MSQLEVTLMPGPVDNPIRQLLATRVELELTNSKGWLIVENRSKDLIRGTNQDYADYPRSEYHFTIMDAAYVGCDGAHNLSAIQAATIFGIACSLQDPRTLFCIDQPRRSYPNYQPDPIPPRQVEVVDTPAGKRITMEASIHVAASVAAIMNTKISLDEGLVLSTAGRLLAFGVYNRPRSRSLSKWDVLKAFDSYTEAMSTVGSLACYQALYTAFEKASNSRGSEKQGADFDKKAAGVTGLTAADLQQLREFNNRIKHAIRRKTDLETILKAEGNFGPLAVLMKRATDAAILSCI